MLASFAGGRMRPPLHGLSPRWHLSSFWLRRDGGEPFSRRTISVQALLRSAAGWLSAATRTLILRVHQFPLLLRARAVDREFLRPCWLRRKLPAHGVPCDARQ